MTQKILELKIKLLLIIISINTYYLEEFNKLTSENFAARLAQSKFSEENMILLIS